MTVKTLKNMLSGMPEDAEVLICFDVNRDREHSSDEYQPADIATVLYDTTTESVELREEWRQ